MQGWPDQPASASARAERAAGRCPGASRANRLLVLMAGPGGEGCAGKYCSPLVLALGPASGDGDQGWDVVAALRRVGVLSPAGGGGGAGGAWSGGAGAGERERPRQHSGLARGPAVARSGSRKRREATRGWWFTRRVRERRAMRKGRGGSGNGPVSASKCCSPPAAGCRQWAGGLDDLAPGDGPGAG